MNFKNAGMDGEDRLPQPVGGGYLRPMQQQQVGIAREPSIYSLTFDEFQNTLGKDFGSMNMEELLKNICSAEETQLTSTSAAAAAAMTVFPEAGGSGLQRQGSLTLPRTISVKTVDEVWKDLFRENSGLGGGGQAPAAVNLQPQHRQPTLGEVTLEEFLVRVGVVREEPVVAPERPTIAGATTNNNNNPRNSMFFGDFTGNGSTGLALGFPSSSRSNGDPTVSQPIQSNPAASMALSSYARPIHLGNSNALGNQQGVQGGGIVGIGDTKVNNGMLSGGVGFGAGGVTAAAAHSPTNPLSDKFGRSNGDLSSLSPMPCVLERGPGKRGSGVEKAVERRQKRMIKNRESAARSRARKQAYTIELETEVAKLKEQNQELQKKQEILEEQKNQVLEMINQQSGTKKQCLRRTQTGPC